MLEYKKLRSRSETAGEYPEGLDYRLPMDSSGRHDSDVCQQQ